MSPSSTVLASGANTAPMSTAAMPAAKDTSIVSSAPAGAPVANPGSPTAHAAGNESVPIEKTTFSDLDEFGFTLFVKWLYGGGLHGPNDFHSTGHYICLYVIAYRFESEVLQNEVMDLLRHYYLKENMTAPAYRVEYIYSLTPGANHMRHFLTYTAAYRCLVERPEAEGVYLSDSMKTLLAKNPEISADFTNDAIEIHRNGILDARRGWDCAFHQTDGIFDGANDGADASAIPPLPNQSVRVPGFPRRHTSPLNTVNNDWQDTASLYVPVPQKSPAKLDQLGMDAQGNPKPGRAYPKKPNLDDDNLSIKSIESMEQHYNNEVKDYWDNLSIHSGVGPMASSYGDTHDTGHRRSRSRSRQNYYHGPPTAMDERIMDASTKTHRGSSPPRRSQNQAPCCRHGCSGPHQYHGPSYPSYAHHVSRARNAYPHRQPSCDSNYSSYAYAGPRLYECHGCDGVSPTPAPVTGFIPTVPAYPAEPATTIIPPGPSITQRGPPTMTPAGGVENAPLTPAIHPPHSTSDNASSTKSKPSSKRQALMRAIRPSPSQQEVVNRDRKIRRELDWTNAPSLRDTMGEAAKVGKTEKLLTRAPTPAPAPLAATTPTTVPPTASTSVVNQENHPGLREPVAVSATPKKDEARSVAGTTTTAGKGLGSKIKGKITKMKVKLGLFMAKHAH
ncbi:hypothetical protein MBLNU230_g4087t1 [Neophaeotheca triangularis]